MKTYLNPEEIEQLKNAAETLRDKLFIEILCCLDCRLSEVLSIEIDHINFQNGTITVKHFESCNRTMCPHCNTKLGRNIELCPGCGRHVADSIKREQEHNSQRVVSVDQETLKMIEEFVEQ